MSGEEESVPAVVRRAGEDKAEIRFPVHIESVHIHLGQPGEVSGKPGSWLMPVIVAVLAGGLAWTAGHLANGRGQGAAPAGAYTPPVPKAAGADPLPPALAAALSEKPVVTPPPGAAAMPSSPSGPAAFGLGE